MNYKCKVLYIFLLLSIAQVNLIANKTWESPQIMFSSSSRLIIKRVDFNKSETLITFEYIAPPSSTLHLKSKITAIDEQMQRYSAISAQGIELDSVMVIPESGIRSFSISFEPLPDNCKIFDLLSNDNNNGIRIYGIHLGTEYLVKPSPNEWFPEENFISEPNNPDTTVIRGHFIGLDFPKLPINISFPSLKDVHSGLSNAPVSDKGYFEISFISHHPVWSNIFVNHQIIQFYGIPGDTIDINIRQWDTLNQEITYSSHKGNPCYSNLLQHGDFIEGATSLDKLSWPAFQEATNDLLTQGLGLSDYISQKYNLSDYEAHLLKNQMRLQYIYRVLFNLNSINAQQNGNNQRQTYGTDMEFLKVINWNDPCLVCTRGWTSYFRHLLLRVLIPGTNDEEDFNNIYVKRLVPYMHNMHEYVKRDFEETYHDIYIAK